MREVRGYLFFGGKLRTTSPGKFVVTGLVAFVGLGFFSLAAELRNWTKTYRQGLIDKSGYYRNRFSFF